MDIGVLISSGRWVLREACTQNVAWQRMGVPPISMGINLSALQFGNASLLADIRSALLHSGMDLSLLELELTEHMVIQNLEQAMDILGAIKREGGRMLTAQRMPAAPRCVFSMHAVVPPRKASHADRIIAMVR